MQNATSRVIKCLLIFGCCFLATEGRYLFPEENPDSLFSTTDLQKKEQINPIVVARPLANFMASEYNRVTSANQHMYRQSRKPYVACKENDMTSCHMMIYLEETLCSRFAQSVNCKPSLISADRKTCAAMVDLVHAQIMSPMKCSNSKNQLKDVTEDEMPFFLNRLQDEDSDLDETNQEDGFEMSKKQWNILDGHPFNI